MKFHIRLPDGLIVVQESPDKETALRVSAQKLASVGLTKDAEGQRIATPEEIRLATKRLN